MPTTELASLMTVVNTLDIDGQTIEEIQRATLEADWNTSNRRVTAVRIRSGFSIAMKCIIESPAIPGGRYEVTVPPKGTVQTNIPSGAGITFGVPAADPEQGETLRDNTGKWIPYSFSGA